MAPSAPAGADPAGRDPAVPDQPQPARGLARVHGAVWLVALATLISLVGRLMLARSVWSPFIFQDEGGYVAVARLLAGDTPSLYGPTYFPVFGILLAPAAAVLEGTGFHRAVQVVNAVAAAATIPAAYLVARRVASLGPWLGAGTAVVGATGAASLLTATMLLPEALFGFLVVVSVLAVHEALVTARFDVALLAGAVVGVTYGVHPRAVVVIVALLGVAALAWRSGVLIPRVAIGLGASSLATALVVQVVHAWATSRLYEVGTWESLAGSPLQSVTAPGGLALITAGQVWYLVVASVGLVPVGLVAAGLLAHAGRGTAKGIAATFVVLGVLGSLALGSIASYQVGLGDVNRADQPVYGRYLEQWIPVLVVFAPTLLRRWSRSVVVATAGAAALLGVVISWGYADEVWELPIAWSNIASLRSAFEVFGREYVLAAGLVAGLAVLVFLGTAVAFRHPAGWALPLLAMAAINLHAGVTTVSEWADPAAKAWAQRHRLGPVLARTDLPVAIGIEENFEVFYGYNLQFWHPDLEVVFTDGATPPAVPLRIDSVSTPPTDDAVLVAAERDGDIGLWALEPGVVDDLRAAVDAEGLPRPLGP